MQIKTGVLESDAVTINQAAAALGLDEFSVLARIQAGDIESARLRSGEMAVPVSELERLSKLSIHSLSIPPDKPQSVLPDAALGIKREPFSGLTQGGERQEYRVPGGDFRRFTESEVKSYRAAFSVIASEFQSLEQLKKQLDEPATVKPLAEKEIATSQLGVWQVRSTLMNLGQSDIVLCLKGNEFAVMEVFRPGTPYAKANGVAEILLERNDPKELAAAFNVNAKHTLELMASNQVATAQKIVWNQYHKNRPARVMGAISERCRSAVANEETIKQSLEQSNSNNRGMSI